MTATEKIKDLLLSIPSISIGYNELMFFSPDELKAEQVGYSFDSDGNSLVGNNQGDWKENWLVIGYDGSVGDPIFVDTEQLTLPVFMSEHGMESWEPEIISISTEEFLIIIKELKQLSINRENPVKYAKSPVPEDEANKFLQNISNRNPGVAIDRWELFFQI